jgi:hypothetical protein
VSLKHDLTGIYKCWEIYFSAYSLYISVNIESIILFIRIESLWISHSGTTGFWYNINDFMRYLVFMVVKISFVIF